MFENVERGNEEVGRPALRAGLGYYRRGVIASTPMAAPDLTRAHLRYLMGMNLNRGNGILRVTIVLLLKFLKMQGLESGIRFDCRTPNGLQANGQRGKPTWMRLQSERSRECDFHADSYWDFPKSVRFPAYPSQRNGSIER